LEPAMGIAIHYIEGLSGMNFLVMKQTDISVIVDIMMGGDGSNKNLEVNEIFISAICEVMNQMMGSSATSMAQFLDQSINISPPEAFILDRENKNYQLNFNDGDEIVTIHFNLEVEDLVTSEFVSVMTMEFANSLIQKVTRIQESTVQQATPQFEPAPAPAPAMETSYYSQPVMQAPPPPPPQPTNPPVMVSKVQYVDLDKEMSTPPAGAPANFDLIMNVPVEVTVEIGRTKKSIKDILEITNGTVIELDKQAGDPVDVIVNGQLIARAEIVVIEDNFGVRITEIVKNSFQKPMQTL